MIEMVFGLLAWASALAVGIVILVVVRNWINRKYHPTRNYPEIQEDNYAYETLQEMFKDYNH